MAHEIMNTAVDEISIVRPGGGDAAGLGVMFYDLGSIPIHPAVTAGGQSRKTRSDDDD